MATISRPRTAPTASTTSTIANGVPAPFPTELLQQERAEGSRNPFITSEEHVEEPVVRQAEVEEEEVGQDAGLVRTAIFTQVATAERDLDRYPPFDRYPSEVVHHDSEHSPVRIH